MTAISVVNSVTLGTVGLLAAAAHWDSGRLGVVHRSGIVACFASERLTAECTNAELTAVSCGESTMGAERTVSVAALQFSCTEDVATNVAKAGRMVRQAHAQGANIVLLQQFFESYYFCQAQRDGKLLLRQIALSRAPPHHPPDAGARDRDPCQFFSKEPTTRTTIPSLSSTQTGRIRPRNLPQGVHPGRTRLPEVLLLSR